MRYKLQKENTQDIINFSKVTNGMGSHQNLDEILSGTLHLSKHEVRIKIQPVSHFMRAMCNLHFRNTIFNRR